MEFKPKMRIQRVPLSQLINETIINKKDLPTHAEKLVKSIFYSNIKDRESQQHFIASLPAMDFLNISVWRKRCSVWYSDMAELAD